MACGWVPCGAYRCAARAGGVFLRHLCRGLTPSFSKDGVRVEEAANFARRTVRLSSWQTTDWPGCAALLAAFNRARSEVRKRFPLCAKTRYIRKDGRSSSLAAVRMSRSGSRAGPGRQSDCQGDCRSWGAVLKAARSGDAGALGGFLRRREYPVSAGCVGVTLADLSRLGALPTPHLYQRQFNPTTIFWTIGRTFHYML